MEITKHLDQKTFSISFEVFPPKTDAIFDTVKNATEKIAALRPSFVSVTYGAGGGTSLYTLAIAENIQKQYGVPSVAHLTCVNSKHETVKQRIEEFKAAGIKNIMALRGDVPPELAGADRSGWDYHYAIELVRELKECGGFCIGGACYPEVHPESANQHDDILRLKEKVDAGCDFLTSQMFFDNNLYYNFLFKIREAGITVPVIPGIMPITSANQINRAIRLSGSYVPMRFISILNRFGSDPVAMKQAGIAYAIDQIVDLFASGIPHVHVYTMNKPDVAEQIMAGLVGILGKSL